VFDVQKKSSLDCLRALLDSPSLAAASGLIHNMDDRFLVSGLRQAPAVRRVLLLVQTDQVADRFQTG
jgi:hypothetical protein